MVSSKKILVQVSVTEKDFHLNADRLLKSLEGLSSAVHGELRVYVVYQTNGEVFPDERFASLPFVTVYVTNKFNVSSARNAAIVFARYEGYDYLVFHDSSMYFTASFHGLINLALAAGGSIYKGQLSWTTDLVESEAVDSIVCVDKKIFPLMDPCVCLYVFRVDYLSDVIFNEGVGPGFDTYIKAGEDVVFLNNLFSARKTNVVSFAKQALVLHPPRPTNNSKRIQYAEAQGTLLRWFFESERFSVSVLIYFFLFFGNTLFGIILGRKNFTKIFRLRLKGFRDKQNLRRILTIKN